MSLEHLVNGATTDIPNKPVSITQTNGITQSIGSGYLVPVTMISIQKFDNIIIAIDANGGTWKLNDNGWFKIPVHTIDVNKIPPEVRTAVFNDLKYRLGLPSNDEAFICAVEFFDELSRIVNKNYFK